MFHGILDLIWLGCGFWWVLFPESTKKSALCNFKWVTLVNSSSLALEMTSAELVNMWKNSYFLRFSHIFTATATTNLLKSVKICVEFELRLAELTHSNLQRGKIYLSCQSGNPCLDGIIFAHLIFL